MERSTNWQNFGLGIVAITIVGLVGWALFHEISQAPWQFITILIALLGTLITVSGNLQIQIRNEQKPKKTEIYDKFINLFLGYLLAAKLGKEQKNEEELIKSLAEITPDLILWASDEVLSLYIKFRQMADGSLKKSSEDNPMLLFGQLLLAIRKDLGHQNKEIDKKSILSTFVNDIHALSK